MFCCKTWKNEQTYIMYRVSSLTFFVLNVECLYENLKLKNQTIVRPLAGENESKNSYKFDDHLSLQFSYYNFFIRNNIIF